MLRKALAIREASILGRSLLMPGLSPSSLSRRTNNITKCCWMRSNHGGGNNTYYDSQSGQHVPLHDENKVEAYLRVDGASSSEAAGSDVSQHVEDLGLSGLVYTLKNQKTHGSNDDADKNILQLIDLHSKADGNNNQNKLMLQLCPSMYHQIRSHCKQLGIDRSTYNMNICFEHSDDEELISESILAAISKGDAASIALSNPTYYNHKDPITVASQVANIIDNTVEEGGSISNILLAPATTSEEGTIDVVDGDDMVRLCEELSYLDVTGPTIKSRLIVSILEEDQLEECLGMGISKYIIDDGDGVEEQLDVLREVVEEQGKELSLSR